MNYPGLQFGSQFNYLRAFLYGLTSSENSFEIKNQEFAFACNKYGLDSPFPFMVKEGFIIERREPDNEEAQEEKKKASMNLFEK